MAEAKPKTIRVPYSSEKRLAKEIVATTTEAAAVLLLQRLKKALRSEPSS